MEEDQARHITAYLDIETTQPCPFDLLFVFGTKLVEPALIATDYMMHDAARYVVLTGGMSRYLGRSEAEAHAEILTTHGVTQQRIIMENKSTSTLENVTFAVPQIKEKLELESVHSIAVIAKWYHCRRAIMTLKRNLPCWAHFYTLPYEPDGIRRADWWMNAEGQKRVLKEWDSIPRYLAKGDLAEIREDCGGFV